MRDSNRRRTVVITGASAGVGRATAVHFARQGWRVGLIARNLERLEDAAREVMRAGGEPLVLAADVADAQALASAAEWVVREWGVIDVWVNNAMVTVYSPVQEMSPEEYRRVTDVTYLGYVHGTLAALTHMRKRNEGTIVQVGSALAYRAIPLQSAYCAAKFAIRGFTDALRSELIHDGSHVRLTAVHLPAINTPQFDWSRSRLPMRPQPVPPIFQPEVAARAIYRAALKAPRELWLGRPTVQIILGSMVMPGILDRLLATQAREGQMSDEPAVPEQPDNLFETVDGEYGSHGRFDSESARRTFGVSSATTHASLGLGLLGLFAGGLALALSRNGTARKRPQPQKLLGRLGQLRLPAPKRRTGLLQRLST
jgi:NAD(P)-dependent dehydrogenase (short-subunit alcohol dehydrogenase family)